MVKQEALCDEHAEAKPPYFFKTDTGFVWTLRDDTRIPAHCHCGKPAGWLKVTSTKDEEDGP
jgi:hypothetical protein